WVAKPVDASDLKSAGREAMRVRVPPQAPMPAALPAGAAVSRYSAYAASLVLTIASLALATRWPGWWWGVAGFGALAVLGTVDLLQRRSTLRRNYPVLAHFRYGLESIGPELRQYFFQS